MLFQKMEKFLLRERKEKEEMPILVPSIYVSYDLKTVDAQSHTYTMNERHLDKAPHIIMLRKSETIGRLHQVTFSMMYQVELVPWRRSLLYDSISISFLLSKACRRIPSSWPLPLLPRTLLYKLVYTSYLQTCTPA